MSYYPAYLDLHNRLVLLVGGGDVAGRKLATLLEAGAKVRLVSPKLNDHCAGQLGQEVEYLARGFEPVDFDGVCLAVSATDDEKVNRSVADEAARRNVFVNVVDVPPLCSFVVPALVRRGELTIAAGTGGAAPAVARRIRERLEGEFGPEWGPYLELMRALRSRVMARGNPSRVNRPIFEALAQAPLLELVKERNWSVLERTYSDILGERVSLADLGLASLTRLGAWD